MRKIVAVLVIIACCAVSMVGCVDQLNSNKPQTEIQKISNIL